MTEKVDRSEVDQVFSALQTGKSDQDNRLGKLESIIDSTLRDAQRDVEDVKQQVVTNLSKKADSILVERLRETTQKKVDQDYMHAQLVKLK